MRSRRDGLRPFPQVFELGSQPHKRRVIRAQPIEFGGRNLQRAQAFIFASQLVSSHRLTLRDLHFSNQPAVVAAFMVESHCRNRSERDQDQNKADRRFHVRDRTGVRCLV
jgi:hypothetical protein